MQLHTTGTCTYLNILVSNNFCRTFGSIPKHGSKRTGFAGLKAYVGQTTFLRSFRPPARHGFVQEENDHFDDELLTSSVEAVEDGKKYVPSWLLPPVVPVFLVAPAKGSSCPEGFKHFL